MTPLENSIASQFPAALSCRAAGGAYLASNTMGLIPLVAGQAELEAVQQQQRSGIAVWDNGEWMGHLQAYSEVIGRLLDVPASWVCPVTNITDGLWRVFSSLDLRGERRGILSTAMAFTTQEYAAYGFERYGAEIITVPSDSAHHTVPQATLVAAIQEHKPAVVHLSHAAFESAYLHDARAIADACHEVGAVFCLDAAQTAFVVPFTMAQTGADVVLVQQHKWGCAGTGAAALVASEAFTRTHAPSLVGWMSHASTFSFKRGPAEFGETAWRFMGGTPEVPAKARGAAAARLIVDEVGVKRVRALNEALVAQLLEGLRGAGLKPIEVKARTGFVAVQLDSEAQAQRVEHALRAKHIYLDGRGARLRIGPHFYNTSEDIQACVRGLAELAR